MGLFSKKPKTVTVTSEITKSRILNENSDFFVQEIYKTLRTNIMFALPHTDETPSGKVIVFSSAIPGEGKTTVCINTAITIAQTGAKVLLIDADLRIPKFHKYFGINGKKGLSDVLGGFCKLNEAVVAIDEHGMDCIPAGQIPPNPAELLASQTTVSLLEELKGIYDYILIDTPPITVVTDALAISPASSGMVLIVREGKTTHTVLKSALKSLEFANVKVLGIINNSVVMGETSYGGPLSKYNYSKAYRYNYKKQ